jgi:hypothetical protein
VTHTSMERAARVVTGFIALVAGGSGIAAVFLTGNELGSAALLVVGMYFAVAVLLGRFPRLSLAGNEIDPGRLEETRRVSRAARTDSEDVKEGLRDTRARLRALEATTGKPERTLAPLPPPPVGVRPDDRLLALAREYDEVRWTMPSGDERTQRMTGILDRMVVACREVEVPDVEALLVDDDPGLRLLGVAHLNARPDPTRVAALVKVATADKPFTEYWALLTLRRVLQGHCDQLGAGLRLALQTRLRELPPGSDRAVAIQAILDDCP